MTYYRDQGRYPRCKSLGLIEAPLSDEVQDHGLAPIRGVKASASLKHISAGHLCEPQIVLSEV